MMDIRMKEPLPEKHVWISRYEECDACNYDTHRCPFCGDALDHEGYDTDGNLHDTAFCRPDLVDHEPGIDCTWPQHGWCYWDHENHRLFDGGNVGLSGVDPIPLEDLVRLRKERGYE